MALEMVDDPQDQQDYNEQTDHSNTGSGNRGGFTGGGGGGSLLNFLPLIFSLFGGGNRRGGGGMGGGIIILLLVAGGFLLFRNGGCSSAAVEQLAQYATGGKLSPEQFKKASVYEGLEPDDQKNPLPEMVSLRRFAPKRLNQGQQGSCVAWSSAYGARTIIESVSANVPPDMLAFSPSFLYNQIGLDGCQGSYLINAMQFLTQKGSVPMNYFPYDENDCTRQPEPALWNFAAQNKMHGFNRLTEDEGVSKISFRAIKEHLAKDAPVVIGMMVGGTFMQDMSGKRVWHPTEEDYQQMGFGGHAMCVIGYDDRVEGGAFEIMNSWGADWGEDGIAYVRYADFKAFVREAYGVDPLPKKGKALTVDLECKIGLVNNDTKQYISLKTNGSNQFVTTAPIAKGTRFKMEILNERQCYIYLFTPDKNGTSQVLFPYKPIHSPYCGITGTRLFPRKESIRADEIGDRDYMGIVVSKEPLDYQQLNSAINASSKATYSAKLNDAISKVAIRNVSYNSTDAGTIYFKANAQEENNVVGCVVAIDKQ